MDELCILEDGELYDVDPTDCEVEADGFWWCDEGDDFEEFYFWCDAEDEE